MGHTNSTPNYALPQFVTTDKPDWLTDINNAFLAIDSAIDSASDAAVAAQNDATQALSDAGAASTAASTADAKGAGAVASLSDAFDATTVYSVGEIVTYNNLLYKCTTAVVTPGPWTGSANWTRTTVEAEIPLYGTDMPMSSGDPTPVTTAIQNNASAISTKMPAAVTVDIDGSALTVSHVGSMYSIGLKACPVSAIYTNLASYTTSKIFRFMAWDMTYNKPLVISIGEGVVHVIEASSWTILSNTDSRTVSGGATYIKV